jgi:hypothetical protein
MPPRRKAKNGGKSKEKNEVSRSTPAEITDPAPPVAVPGPDPTSDNQDNKSLEEEITISEEGGSQTAHVVLADLSDDVEADGDDPKKKPYMWTEEQEKDIAEWWCANEFLYIKRLKEYKNTERKTVVIKEKAESLDPPATGN